MWEAQGSPDGGGLAVGVVACRAGSSLNGAVVPTEDPYSVTAEDASDLSLEAASGTFGVPRVGVDAGPDGECQRGTFSHVHRRPGARVCAL